MRRPWLTLLILCSAAYPQTLHFERHEIRDLGKERIAGAVLDGKRLITWGDRILSWDPPKGDIHPLKTKLPRALGPGGALLDLDGQPDLILNEASGRRALLWINLSSGASAEIDRGIYANEILAATIHGRRGVLLIQRRMQVRFYEIPSGSAHDIYSFYSPSDQGGLLITDVDRDGRPDIVAGNYWIQCPEDFALPWRLFAIRAWSEEKLSGMVQMALSDLMGTGIPNLIVSQSEMENARVAWSEKPTDPKELWTEHRIEGSLVLNQPRSIQVADFDGDGKPDILVVERAGAGRIVILRNEGAGKFAPVEIGRTSGAIDARVMDLNGDGRPDILIVGTSSLSWWENR